MPRITKVSLFVEPLPAFFLGSDVFMSSVDVNPPDTLIKSADEALELGGELVSYANRHPMMKVEKIGPMTNEEQQRFFQRKAITSDWRVYFASTANKDKRYSVLVEFGLTSLDRLDDILNDHSNLIAEKKKWWQFWK